MSIKRRSTGKKTCRIEIKGHVTNLGHLGHVSRLGAILEETKMGVGRNLEILKNLKTLQERKGQDLLCTEFSIQI